MSKSVDKQKRRRARKEKKDRKRQKSQGKSLARQSKNNPFSRFEKEDLLSKLACLNLIPDNQCRTVRLELAQWMACLSNNGDKIIDSCSLSSILNQHFPDDGFYAMQEDPIDNMFTDVVIFHGGSYVVHPGITEQGAFILQKILNGIFKAKNGLSNDFKKEAYNATVLLLTLSDKVAKKANHERYLCENSKSKQIVMPENNVLESLSDACIFTKHELEILFRNLGIPNNTIDSFILSLADSKLSTNEWFNNPIHKKPFVKIGNKLILLQPSCLIAALRHFIIVSAQKYGQVDCLSSTIKKVISKNINFDLTHMGYSRIDFKLPTFGGCDFIDETIYQFDKNKYCYVQIVTDNFADYNSDNVYGHINIKDVGRILQNRQDKINKLLFEDTSINCNNALNLVVLAGSGRSMVLGFNSGMEKTYLLCMSDEELDIAVKSGERDQLTLWKFTRSHSNFLDKHPKSFPANSFLDLFALYLEHSHSFTLSDDKLSLFVLEVGYGNKLRVKAKKALDTHAVQFDNRLVIVHKRYSDGHIPVYFSEDLPLSFRYIGKYPFSLWVLSDTVEENAEDINRCFSEMFAYWLWQLSSLLFPKLASLSSLSTLKIYFKIEDSNKWLDNKFYEDGNAELRYELLRDGIKIIIPLSFRQKLHEPTNSNETKIIHTVLVALNRLSNTFLGTNLYSESEIDVMLNSVIRNPRQKMLLVFASGRPSANAVGIPKLRLLQKNDEDNQLEGLATLLKDNKLPVGKIESIETQLSMLKEIVEICLQRLREKIFVYNYDKLISELISYQEAIWQKRMWKFFHLPAELECFFNEKEHVKKYMDEVMSLNVTSISIRFLLEFIAAEPPVGENILSLDDYDSVVATAYNFFNWAIHYEQIVNGVFDPELSILPNGRVGRNQNFMDDFKNNYVSSKMQENIGISYEAFPDLYSNKTDTQDSSQKTDSDINKAVQEEFGLDWDEIVSFYSYLVELGFERGTPVVRIELGELLALVGKKLEWPEDKVRLAICNFSLARRSKWEEAPKGYNFTTDIAPWHYKRRLSYILRPLIKIKIENGEEIVYWGPRHVDESLRYLSELISRGQYRAVSTGLKKQQGKIKKEIGDKYNLMVFNFFKDNKDYQVEKNIKINSFYKSNEDYGDIDILLVNSKSKIVYPLECKYIYPGRNPREIASEIERLFDDTEKRSWTKKHLDRDKIIKQNLKSLSKLINFDVSDCSVVSAILTSEEIPASFLRDTASKFLNFRSIKREGFKIIEELE